MIKRLLLGFLFLYFINLSVSAQIQDSCTFVEKDSIITIEMESANLNGGFWVYQNNKPGYLGSGFIQYVGGDATGTPGKNQLSYTFRVKEAGRHSFKMRAYREGYDDNDVWVKFPHGGVVTKIGDDSTGTMGDNWFKAVIGSRGDWYGFVKTQHLGTAWGEKFHDIYVDFPAPGVYTVQFSGRASGFRIDRLMMYYKKSSFFGMNTANAESPRENCSPYYTPAGKPYVANPIPDQSINGNTAWTYTVPANTFAGGTSIGYSSYLEKSTPLPSWITFNQATATFTANPTYANGGKYTIVVKAEDNGYQAVDAFSLTVLGNNPPLMAISLKDTNATEGRTFIYDIQSNFSDSDGHSLSYTVSSHEGASLPSWLGFSGTAFTGNPAAADIGNDTIYVTVNDGNGGSITQSFIILVNPSEVAGLKKGTQKMSVSLYPNPVDDIIFIKAPEAGNGTLLISDNLGRIQASYADINLEKELSLDISSMNLKSGFYHIRIKSSENAMEYHGLIIKK